MTKSNEILEALKMQPLTEEEKASRHILGRWYGPIATCNEGTRNGRKYNRELWERALNDELFHEKIANKCLFLELGHPIDREETDMSKVCACIPEMPKIIDGDLCAYVDVLDTPNGKILKTLCDYGFIPGISSRGSGDIMPNDEVDPETFFLECWDIVGIPAVKKARLSMCESIDSNTIKLKKALTESINKASEEDKVIMKETLENLEITIDDESTEELTEKRLSVDEIPWDPEENPKALTEEVPEEEAVENTETETEDASEDTEAAAETAEETEAEETEATAEVNTVGEVVELLQEFDSDLAVEFEAVTPEGEAFGVDTVESFIDEDEGALVISMNGCDSEAGNAEEHTDSDIEEVQTEDTEIFADDSTEATEQTDSAEDAGDEEVMESLKEMIRQKEALETEVSALRKARTVGDAKEQELQEKLDRYRAAFRNTSAEAAKVPELQAKVKELTEQLVQKTATISTLTEQVSKARQLKESTEQSNQKVAGLTEQVAKLTKHSEALEAKLAGQTKQYNAVLQERTQVAKKYKTYFIETLTKYVESKASMLGVQPSEITSRLNESYTLKDVDAVCEEILESTVNFSRLPFSGRSKASVRINESASRNVKKTPEFGYDIDDDLLELAGLKK